VFNDMAASGAPAFVITAGGLSGPSVLLFATEQGGIAGWNPDIDRTRGVLAVDRSAAGAAYTGLALALDGRGVPFLYAANFAGGVVEVFDAQFQMVRTFTDPLLAEMCPHGPESCFAPFNVRAFGGLLYVAYALQDAARRRPVPGAGHGFVVVFDVAGRVVRRLISRGPLNAPYGMAMVPQPSRASHPPAADGVDHLHVRCRCRDHLHHAHATPAGPATAHFGPLDGALLVANRGDGLIHAFDPLSGAFIGRLADRFGRPLVVDHLHSIEFCAEGTGAELCSAPNSSPRCPPQQQQKQQQRLRRHTDCDPPAPAGPSALLFFVAGISGGAHGLFGYICLDRATVDPA
jgi:hypothetical protein